MLIKILTNIHDVLIPNDIHYIQGFGQIEFISKIRIISLKLDLFLTNNKYSFEIFILN